MKGYVPTAKQHAQSGIQVVRCCEGSLPRFATKNFGDVREGVAGVPLKREVASHFAPDFFKGGNAIHRRRRNERVAHWLEGPASKLPAIATS